MPPHCCVEFGDEVKDEHHSGWQNVFTLRRYGVDRKATDKASGRG